MAFAPACTPAERPPSPSHLPPPPPPPPARLHPADLGIGVLFDRIQDAVVVADLSSTRIVLWNPAAERLFGYTADEAIGKPIELLIPTPMAHLHRTAVERYRQTGRGLIMDATGPVEVPSVASNGTELRVEISLSMLSAADGQVYAMAVMRSAMQRKAIELMRLEIERLRRLASGLTGLLALASSNDV